MDGKSSAYLIRALVVMIFVAAIFVPSVRGHNAATDAIVDRMSTDRADVAPIIVAQRCFNGRCY